MNDYNILTLAFIGDAHYNLYAKRKIIDRNFKVNDMQKDAAKYCSARFQAQIVHQLIEENFLSDEELSLYKRGRNAKSHGAPKNTDILSYKSSTGFEALWGYLYLNENTERMKQIWEIIETIKE